ncbi:MAG: DUF58 domain-containing protein [Polyangiales bacterium]
MGLLDLLRRAKPAAPKRDDDLFDEAFQRRLEWLAVVSRRVFGGRLRAERRTKKSGSGLEFVDHREYSPGDDLRALDWAVYGRTERMLLKLFEEEEDLAIYILLDCSASMAWGSPSKFDHARKLAAAMAYVGLASLDRVALIAWSSAVTRRMPPARGKGRIFKVFEFLRATRPEGQTALADAARAFAAENKRRGVAVIISDLYDPAGFEHGINAIRYLKFEPMVIHVVDPREADPGASGDVALVDVETSETREVTLTPALVEKYREAHAAWRAEVEGFCKQRQIPYVAASIAEPFEEQVLGLLRRVGMVG